MNENLHTTGFFTPPTGTHLEGYELALQESLAPHAFDGRPVHEQVVTVVAFDEPEAPAGVEPLDRAAGPRGIGDHNRGRDLVLRCRFRGRNRWPGDGPGGPRVRWGLDVGARGHRVGSQRSERLAVGGVDTTPQAERTLEPDGVLALLPADQ